MWPILLAGHEAAHLTPLIHTRLGVREPCAAVARRHMPQRVSVCGYLVVTYFLAGIRPGFGSRHPG